MNGPAQAVLDHFGVIPVADLGGRRNRHWQVQRHAETLVLRRWAGTLPDMEWERDVRARVAVLGWPVAPDVSGLFECGGAYWSLAPMLPGEPWREGDARADERWRGRLLAEFHQSVQPLHTLPQRPGWRRAEVILADPHLERTLQACPNQDESRLYLWHLHCARELAAGLPLAGRPNQLLHGDCIPQNVLLQGGKLSGLLDFELSHLNHRAAEFCLAWRGQHDEIIHAYHEVSPLEDVEWAMLTPLWWAHLLEDAYSELQRGLPDDGWTVRMLLRRSPLMHEPPYRAG